MATPKGIDWDTWFVTPTKRRGGRFLVVFGDGIESDGVSPKWA
jgi:hypothetical protein